MDNKFLLLFPCRFFPTFPTTKSNTTVTARSTQPHLAEIRQALQHRRQIVHRGERHAVLGAQQPLDALQVSAPQRLGLGEGAAGHQHPGEPQSWIATGAKKNPRASCG